MDADDNDEDEDIGSSDSDLGTYSSARANWSIARTSSSCASSCSENWWWLAATAAVFRAEGAFDPLGKDTEIGVGAGAVAGDKGWNVGKYSCELDGRDEGEGELHEVPDESGEGKTLGKRRSKSGGEVGSSLSSASYSFAGLSRTDACI